MEKIKLMIASKSYYKARYKDTHIISIKIKQCVSQDPRFFDKLGVLCVCNERPIPEKQSGELFLKSLSIFCF